MSIINKTAIANIQTSPILLQRFKNIRLKFVKIASKRYVKSDPVLNKTASKASKKIFLALSSDT